ncbi:hypothetical protein ACJIZ3_018410 [Penstemon smallii]|uniref:Ataxin-10 domain-containing protein n=1 Tax=Penstemon smallii TaxID=265156 RepID=A0ABD3SZM6_9LAMI
MFVLVMVLKFFIGTGKDAADMLVSAGLIELLLTLLRELEPPTIIRKAMAHSEAKDGTTSHSNKYCPYTGFRRDIIAIIGNCCYRRKHVQDIIRELDRIILLLQQCIIDEDNPFSREWGIIYWTQCRPSKHQNIEHIFSLFFHNS